MGAIGAAVMTAIILILLALAARRSCAVVGLAGGSSDSKCGLNG